MSEFAGERAFPRWLIVLLGIAATVLAVAGFRSAAEIITPVFLAFMLVIAVYPVLSWARAHGAPQWLAVTLALLVLYTIVIGMVVTLGISTARLAALLPQYSDEMEGLLGDVRSLLTSVGVGREEVASAFAGFDPQSVLGFVKGLFSGLLGAVGGLLFVLATALFMGVDASGLPDRLRAVPGVSPSLPAALGTFAEKTRSYLVVSTVFGLIVAVIDTVALLLLGIPLPILWGLLSLITNYIPNVGFFIGLIPPTLLALLVEGPRLAVLVVVVYCVGNFVIQSIIQPAVVGDAVGLSVTVTFLSLVAWTWILGPLGALLALPLSLLVKAVLLDADPERAWARALVSSPPGTGRRQRHPAPAPDKAEPAPVGDEPSPAALTRGEQSLEAGVDDQLPGQEREPPRPVEGRATAEDHPRGAE
jgi:predicted PurR-regulated permease PerM